MTSPVGSEVGGKFFKYLDELLGRLKKTVILFLIIFFLLFLTGPVPFLFHGIRFYYIFPSFYGSFSVLLFRLMEVKLLPKGLILINVSPFDIVVSDVYISLAASLSVVIPILVYQILRFAEPALYIREKKAINYSIFPIFILFIAGAVFALIFIIPLLMKVIYSFAIDLHILPTIGVKNFISIVLLITVGMGLVFETPVVIFGLSYLRVVSPSVWLKNWRYAVVGAFFIALLISPGATGGIMETTIAVIIIVLYFSGALLAKKFYHEQE
jgi:sec-independent protein translocase protein TatC